MAKKGNYIEKNGKYLTIKENGKTQLFESKAEFNKYLKRNKLKPLT